MNEVGKAKRGRGIKKTANWRGSCPACERTGVKLLWEKLNDEGNSIKVCKMCGSK